MTIANSTTWGNAFVAGYSVTEGAGLCRDHVDTLEHQPRLRTVDAERQAAVQERPRRGFRQPVIQHAGGPDGVLMKAVEVNGKPRPLIDLNLDIPSACVVRGIGRDNRHAEG